VRHKIPPESFDYYNELGPSRTYTAVARRFGVSLRGVTKRAIREGWQERLRRIEEGLRRKQDERAVEDASAVDERHLKMSRAIQARALEALRSMPISSGMAAVRALDVSIKIERAILGRGKDSAPSVGTHAALTEAAGAVPAEVVQAMLEAGRRAMVDRADGGPTSRGPGGALTPASSSDYGALSIPF